MLDTTTPLCAGQAARPWEGAPSCDRPRVVGVTPFDGPRPTREETASAWQDTDALRARATLWRAQLWEHWTAYCGAALVRDAVRQLVSAASSPRSVAAS